jgi:hypothetical protein
VDPFPGGSLHCVILKENACLPLLINAKETLMSLKGAIFNSSFLEGGNSPKILKVMDGGEW